MRNRIINITTKAKSLAQIEREERESQSQRTPATGRASASAGASVSHSSAKPANLISSANANRPLKTLPQIEREERESTRQSSRSHAAGNASGGVGNVVSKINPDSIIRAADTARNGNKATRTERYRIQTADVPSTSTSDQRAEAALLAKLPSDFPIDRWDNMSTKEQNSIMRRSGLTVQEQWKLLNATTPMKALSVLNAVQAGLNNGTLTSREAAALTGGSLRYAETKKQLANADASVLPPLQKKLLRGELEDEIDSIRAKAEGVSQPSDSNLSRNGDSPSIAMHDPANISSEKPNVKHIQMFQKDESVPHKLRKGEYYFVEETAVLGNMVVGHTVLFDEDKYAEYQYVGLAIGKSIVPSDHLWVKGYVNNVYDVQDYEGPFFNMAAGIGPVGASASLGYNKNRKAYVVAGSEVAQQIFAGLSMSYQDYKCSTTDWVYDEAPISWGDTLYDQAFGNYSPEEA